MTAPAKTAKSELTVERENISTEMREKYGFPPFICPECQEEMLLFQCATDMSLNTSHYRLDFIFRCPGCGGEFKNYRMKYLGSGRGGLE